MRSCSSSVRALSGFSRSEEASKIVQRDVNATSSANSTTTSPYRRRIGRFMSGASFELPEFEAAYERGGVRFRAQRMIEQRFPALRRKRRGAHAGDVLAAVEGDVSGEPVRHTLVERHQTAAVGGDEVNRLQCQVGRRTEQADDSERDRDGACAAQTPTPARAGARGRQAGATRSAWGAPRRFGRRYRGGGRPPQPFLPPGLPPQSATPPPKQ